MQGGDRFAVPGIGATFDVIDVPGHTAGHIALFGEFGGGPVLFCGDTLFTGGCGRLFEGTPEQMWTSLSALAALPPRDARVLRARIHACEPSLRAGGRTGQRGRCRRATRGTQARRDRGEPTVPSTMGEERATNPFLRAHLPAVRAAAAAHAGHALADDVASFAALREWKNALLGRG